MTLNQRLSIHPINTTYPLKSKQQAAVEHVVFILESELAITYSDWRASIRHFKTLCNWCLSADCLWICSVQINTAQLYVCNAVIVMHCGGGKVKDTLGFLNFSTASLYQPCLLWGPLRYMFLWHLRVLNTAYCISTVYSVDCTWNCFKCMQTHAHMHINLYVLANEVPDLFVKPGSYRKPVSCFVYVLCLWHFCRV